MSSFERLFPLEIEESMGQTSSNGSSSLLLPYSHLVVLKLAAPRLLGLVKDWVTTTGVDEEATIEGTTIKGVADEGTTKVAMTTTDKGAGKVDTTVETYVKEGNGKAKGVALSAIDSTISTFASFASFFLLYLMRCFSFGCFLNLLHRVAIDKL